MILNIPVISSKKASCDLFDDSLIYSEISKKNEDRQIPIKQMLRDDALKAFELWSKKTDKIKY